MVWAAALVLAAGAATFDLDCKGGTVVNATTSTTTAAVYGQGGNATGAAVTTEPTYVPFEVRVIIADGIGEVQLPAGERQKLKKIVILDDSVTAQYGGFLDRRKFHIDRHSGKIMTSAGFEGSCKPHEETPRAF